VFYYSWVAQATDTEQSKGKWTKGDIVEFVAMLLAVPAGLGAFIMLVSYVRRVRRRTTGKSFVVCIAVEVEPMIQAITL